MRKVCFYLTALCLVFAVSAAHAEKMRIVVMNLKADGVSDRTSRTVSNMLRTEFINMNEFIVVERAQMDAILKEQGVQASGCTDQACAVQMGRLMSAKKILVGEVSPMGKSIITTVRIVDVEKGVSEFAATQKAASEEVLDVSVKKIASKLAARIRAGSGSSYSSRADRDEPDEPVAPGTITKSGYYLRGIVPGWGQHYAGYSTKMWIYGGIFVVTGTLAIINFGQYNTAKAEYEDLGQGYTPETYDDHYTAYEDAAKRASLFGIIFAAGYLANWVDLLFFTKPAFGETAGLVEPAGETYVTFNSYRTDYPYREDAFDMGMNMRF